MKDMDPRIISIQQAEFIAGEKLDRRRNYAIIRGQICASSKFTDVCSGCFEAGEYMGNAHNYGYDDKHGCYVGSGCEECGYTGKRIQRYWIPLSHREGEYI